MSHPTIRKVAVLGAGVMGTGIAAHLANAGIESLLFDIVPKDAEDRNVLAKKGIETAKKLKPAPLFRRPDAKLITPCNMEDDGARLAECDWIVEVVVERLDIKKKVFSWVAENRKPGSIVSSNTSGIPLADMAADMPEEMKKHFLVTHFFNPVRYMRLLEIVQGEHTDAAVVARMAEFGDKVLGKGIVYCKDTPNFIANRIGTYGMASVFRHMEEKGLTVEQVDAIFGPAMGRPKSAVFRTADVVGLDTLRHVFDNLHEYLVDDDEREIFKLPAVVDKLLADGRAGQKSGAGFYKKVKEGGKSKILALDPATLEYREQDKVRFPSIGAAKKASKQGKKEKALQAMVYGDDVASEAAWRCTADTLIYSAKRIPEIADDVVNVDRAMKWGFGWEMGPFETWDAIGVRQSVEKMQAEGREVPGWVLEMLASGRESFYARTEDGTPTYAQKAGGAATVPYPEGQLFLSDVKAARGEVKRNGSASLLDLGDSILGLELHSPAFMNALDADIIGLLGEALDALDDGQWDGLVIASEDPRAFCAGANLGMIGMAIGAKAWDQIEDQIATLQGLMQRAKYSARPVITAPHGMALGGGCELAMHSTATVAAGETYIGLVEVGVGLIPGAGGCKEMVVRYLGDFPQDVDYDPNPFVQKAFERIGMAKVAAGAGEARDFGFLRPTDQVAMNVDRRIYDAKALARGLADAGYKAPAKRTVKLPGPTGKAAIELFLYQMQEGGFISEYDAYVGKTLAHVLCGGDIPWGTRVTEDRLLELEREAFLHLCGQQKTQERIAHFAMTGKPLRN